MPDILPGDLSGRESHILLTSLFTPRPIAFVGTVSADGTANCAPFSFANGISSKPPVLMVAISDGPGGAPKDTLANILETKDFTVNMVTGEIADRMHLSSARFAPDVSEFEEVGLTPRPSDMIRSPGIAQSPITMELELRETLRLEGTRVTLVFGTVLVYHVDDALIEDGAVIPERLKVVGRLGKDTYCRVTDIFRLDPVVRKDGGR